MTPNLPSPPENSTRIRITWLAPALLLLAGTAVWVDHFSSGFHVDDSHTIVSNGAVAEDGPWWRFFAGPDTFGDLPQYADYRPLLSASYSLDYHWTPHHGPEIFQLDSFFWFFILLVTIYLLFRLAPGMGHYPALLSLAVFAFNPVTAETVNYASRRGEILGALGVVAGLALWIYWPDRLPKKLGLDLNKVPKTYLDELVWNHGGTAENLYRRFRKLRLGVFFIPVALAMFANPAAGVVFVLLTLVYLRIFEPRRDLWTLLPSALACGVYWLGATILTWRVAGPFRIPALSYWPLQPWVAARFLYDFLLPFQLTFDPGLTVFPHWWPLMSLAGCVVLGGVVVLAVAAARRDGWQLVSLGLWWFLIVLLPSALVPQRMLDDGGRMFLPAVGLALAVGQAARFAGQAMLARSSRIRLLTAGLGLGGIAILAGYGWMTAQRNVVWASDDALWLDSAERDRHNSRAMVNVGHLAMKSHEESKALYYLNAASALPAADADAEIELARDLDVLQNEDSEIERHFRSAIQLSPALSGAYSAYGEWLLARRRMPESLKMSLKAVSLSGSDLTARHNLMAIYSEQYNWAEVKRIAGETLAFAPEDDYASNMLAIAEAGIESLSRAEGKGEQTATVNDYLGQSVILFKQHRYEESIASAKQALQLQPGLVEAYANMATAYHAMGRVDDAIAATQEVLRLRPGLYFALSDLQVLRHEKSMKAGR